MKIKLRDLTEEQYKSFRCNNNNSCKECIFNKVNCTPSMSTCWIYNKDLFSDKFLNQEIEINPILTNEEKEYLEFVLKPFRENIVYLKKLKTSLDEGDKEYIVISFKEMQSMLFPFFEQGKMYEGMKLYKDYTPDELGLWENRGNKDK